MSDCQFVFFSVFIYKKEKQKITFLTLRLSKSGKRLPRECGKGVVGLKSGKGVGNDGVYCTRGNGVHGEMYRGGL